MLELLWTIPTIPVISAFILALIGARVPRSLAGVVGTCSVGLSAVLSTLVSFSFVVDPPPGFSYTQTLWSWVNVPGFSSAFALRLDALSLIMTMVVLFVSFMIHLYSAAFMSADEGYSRFFASMNLFVGAMLILVLAGDLLMLYLGWEGVGLCSYLLIGFWYQDKANGYAARKAFVVTRVGDTAMAIGLLIIATNLGTLQIDQAMLEASRQWQSGSGVAIVVASLLLAGAVGKSAQLPLQVWLPDAMAGPAPVSALIHAATMVTAGVYLVARTHILFLLAPAVLSVVAMIGTLTLLLGASCALVQKDIKRILAYSTISQIGYMFLALGVGAWSSAVFHFMTHAFFKALLFLGAGVVIQSLGGEHDIFKMGGLRKSLPLTFWTFVAGAASLASMPLFSAGFYSKDLILWEAWSSGDEGRLLCAAGLVGAFLTAIYALRLVFIVFFGRSKTTVRHRPKTLVAVPLVILALLSLLGGLAAPPQWLSDMPSLLTFLEHSLPRKQNGQSALGSEILFGVIAATVSLAGAYAAYLLFHRHKAVPDRLLSVCCLGRLHRFLFAGWGFDWLYGKLIVNPFVWLAHIVRNDPADVPYEGIAWYCRWLHGAMSATQTGRVRLYAFAVALGAVLMLGLVVLQ